MRDCEALGSGMAAFVPRLVATQCAEGLVLKVLHSAKGQCVAFTPERAQHLLPSTIVLSGMCLVEQWQAQNQVTQTVTKSLEQNTKALVPEHV